MLVLALVVLALLVVFMLGALIGSEGSAQLEIFGAQIDTTVASVLITGFVAGLLALLMLVLAAIGARRTQLRRKRQKELRRQAAEGRAVVAERDALAEDKARLERQAQDTGSAAPPEDASGSGEPFGDPFGKEQHRNTPP